MLIKEKDGDYFFLGTKIKIGKKIMTKNILV